MGSKANQTLSIGKSFPVICGSPKMDVWFKSYDLLKFKVLKPQEGRNITYQRSHRSEFRGPDIGD